MSRTLLRLATDFRMDNRIVPWDELTGSDTIMNELAHELRRSGWPERTYEEVCKELLRLHGRWKKVVQTKSENFIRTAGEHTYLWTADAKKKTISSSRAPRARVPHRQRARVLHHQRARVLHRRRMTMMPSCGV